MRIQQIFEAPIYPTDEPMNPVVQHGKSNPMELRSRISQTRGMLKDLAERAQTDDLGTWEQITKLALGGGLTQGLVQNLEVIQHGIEELRAKRAKGGTQSRGIDKF